MQPLFALLTRFSTLKRGLLLFWALWLTVVTTTNVLNVFVATGVLPASFKFSSGNWPWIQQTMNPLGVPEWLQAFQFGGVIIWEGIAAVCFWLALFRFRDRPLSAEPMALAACTINLALWAAFQIMDEVFLAYTPEAVHRVLFGNMILTILALHFLPTDTSPE